MTWPYEAEVSRSYLSQIEKGVFFASLKIVGKLATALNVEPTELRPVSRSWRSRVSGAKTYAGRAAARRPS